MLPEFSNTKKIRAQLAVICASSNFQSGHLPRCVYICVCVCVFVFFFPIYVYIGVSTPYLNPLFLKLSSLY